MRIIIAGGSGLIGSALANLLVASGHQVWVLTRNAERTEVAEGAHPVRWDGYSTNGWESLVSQADAIINLAGENLGSGYWTRKRKEQILTSRTNAGKAISEAIHRANPRPGVLIQASAVGFYGPRGSEPVTEETAPGQGFLAEVCQAWEASSQPVEEMGVRRVVIRTGVVLTKNARRASAHDTAIQVLCWRSYWKRAAGYPVDPPGRRSGSNPVPASDQWCKGSIQPVCTGTAF